MTKDDIIRMMREAHLDVYGLGKDREKFVSVVDHFANLIAAAERETWRNAAIRVGEDLATCGPDNYYNFTAQQWLEWALNVTSKMQADYMNFGACGEREACAKVCEELEYDGYEMLPRAPRMARLIRARGSNESNS